MSHDLKIRVSEKVLNIIVITKDTDTSKITAGPQQYYHEDHMPDFHSNMDAAMMMVDKLGESGNYFEMCQFNTDDDEIKWTVVIEGFDGSFEAEHKSLPTAICLVALRIVGDGEWAMMYLERETKK